MKKININIARQLYANNVCWVYLIAKDGSENVIDNIEEFDLNNGYLAIEDNDIPKMCDVICDADLLSLTENRFDLKFKDLRDITGIIANEALLGILERFDDFISNSETVYSSWEEGFKKFFKPVEYFDFMALSNKTFVFDGVEYELVSPNYFMPDNGKKKKDKTAIIPQNARTKYSPRFNSWTSVHDVPYPIDADMRIYVDFKRKYPSEKVYENTKCVLISYNELAHKCKTGRILHWIEVHKTPMTVCNTFIADLNKASFGAADPLYRKTPDGQLKVDKLISPGTIIKSSYSTQEYIVAKVVRDEYKPIERPDQIFESFWLSLIAKDSRKGGYSISELVAVDGRILKLFVANEDEIFILGKGMDTSFILEDNEDENDDEFDGGCCRDFDDEGDGDCVIAVAKKTTKKPSHIQLSLF